MSINIKNSWMIFLKDEEDVGNQNNEDLKKFLNS